MSSRVVERCVQPPAVWALVGSWSDREVTVYWGPPLLLASALTKEAAEVMWWVGVFTLCIYFINTGSGTELLATEKDCRWHALPPQPLCGEQPESDLCEHGRAASFWEWHLKTQPDEQRIWAVDILVIDFSPP